METHSRENPRKALPLIALALAIGVMGIYVANADDAPGAAVIRLLLMLGAVVLGVKAARNRLPSWAARTALAVGALIAAFAAFLTHATVVAAPLFAQPLAVGRRIGGAAHRVWTVLFAVRQTHAARGLARWNASCVKPLTISAKCHAGMSLAA